MKIYTAIVCIFFLFAGPAWAQDVKKIGSVYAGINGQHPDKYIYEDDNFRVKFVKGFQKNVEMEIYNKTDEYAIFKWSDTHFVINGASERADNLGVSKVEMGLFHSTQVDNLKDQIISPNSSYFAKLSSDNLFFDPFAARKSMKENGAPVTNKVILAIGLKGAVQKIPIDFEIYYRKPKSRK